MPILYDLNFLGLKYSLLKMTIPQMQSLSTIWLKMSHFIRSVSYHGKCGIESKVNQKTGKTIIFVLCEILKCDLLPSYTSKGTSMVTKNFLVLLY